MFPWWSWCVSLELARVWLEFLSRVSFFEMASGCFLQEQCMASFDTQWVAGIHLQEVRMVNGCWLRVRLWIQISWYQVLSSVCFWKISKLFFWYCIICIPVDPFDPKRFPLIFVICTPIYLWKISETWYDMITKKQEHRSITKLWESCLPILAPPDCVRDAHVRWISTATTSNGLDKRGWLSKQMLADVGRCWQGLRNRNRNLQKCNLINITYLVNLVLVCSSVEVHFSLCPVVHRRLLLFFGA